MKKTILLLVYLFITFSSASALQIDERKIDIYFGNGVWNDETSAEDGRRELEDLIQFDLIFLVPNVV